MLKSIQNKSSPLVLLTISILTIVGVSVGNKKEIFSARSEVSQEEAVIDVKTVTALGRIEPEGEVVYISAPRPNQGARLEKLWVEEGDIVEAGEVIGVLDQNPSALSTLEEAKQKVKFTEAKLEQINAGAPEGQIRQIEATIAQLEAELRGVKRTNDAQIARLEAQLAGDKKEKKAIIARLKSELANYKLELQRYTFLANEGAVAQSILDLRRLDVETTEKKLLETEASLGKSTAIVTEEIKETESETQRKEESLRRQIEATKADLDRVKDIRGVDVAVIEAEVTQAQASVAKAEADLDLTYITTPQGGQVLDILTKPGETIPTQGLLKLASTETMYVVAEIYETDIHKINLGQMVNVSSPALSGSLKGAVAQIGLEVKRQEVINSDPSANIDNRIVEVRVKLDPESSEMVKGLTNLAVMAQFTL